MMRNSCTVNKRYAFDNLSGCLFDRMTVGDSGLCNTCLLSNRKGHYFGLAFCARFRRLL